MREMSSVKKSIITAVCLALCVVLPLVFYAFPNGGLIYCPLHIPVLLCGLVCGWPYGLLCGLAGPLLSTVITGVTPATLLPVLMLECITYGVISGLLMRTVHTKKVYPDLYISMLTAMIGGRAVSGAANALIFTRGGYSMVAWIMGSFLISLPGIIVQLAFLPSIVYALMKAGLIPNRYSTAAY